MNILKNFQRLQAATEMYSEKKDVPCNIVNIARLQIRVKSFETTKRSALLVNLQFFNLQIRRKINSSTSIFKLVYLPLRTPASKKTSKNRVTILRCNVCYVTEGVLLIDLGCSSLYF